jgi:hypothetical protein
MQTEEIESIDEPKAHVMFNGDWIPLDSVTFENVEEDIQGRDLITFTHEGVTKQYYVTMQNI